MHTWRRVSLTVLAAVLPLVATAPPTSAAAAKTTTTTAAPRDPRDEPIGSNTIVNSWAVAPVSQSTDPTQPSERPYLSYSVVPGQVINDAVILYNYSNVPLTFHLYPTDAFNNADGAFDALASNKRPTGVGSWVRMEQQELALPPKSQATVPLTITVPAKVTPGDHAGAVLASSIATGTGPDGKSVSVDRRTGTRLYVRVAGPLSPELAITQVSNTYRPSINPFSGKTDVTYRVENEGNVRMAGKHRVSVSGLLGLGGKSNRYLDVPELLPGQFVDFRVSFKGMPASFLTFATVKVDPDNVERRALGVVSRRAATIAIPWTIVALAVVFGLLRYARRQYRRHNGLEASTNRPKVPQPA